MTKLVVPKTYTGFTLGTDGRYYSNPDQAPDDGGGDPGGGDPGEYSAQDYIDDHLARVAASSGAVGRMFTTQGVINEGYHASSTGTMMTLSSTHSLMGNSMRIRIPNGFTGADASGKWADEEGDGGMDDLSFGANSTCYLQFRQYLTPQMYSQVAANGGLWKLFILRSRSAPPTDHEVVFSTSNSGGHGFGYLQGDRRFQTETDSPDFYDGTQATATHYHVAPWHLTQVGGNWVAEDDAGLSAPFNGPSYPFKNYNSSPRQIPWPTTGFFTVYMKLGIGPSMTTYSSTLEVWVQLPGESFWRKLIGMRNVRLNTTYNLPFDLIHIDRYMTGGFTGVSSPVDSYFQDYIISPNPIGIPLPSPVITL